MGVALAVVAVEAIEALQDGVTFRAGESQSPFAEGRRCVACGLEGFGDGDGIFRDRKLADGFDFPVAPAGCVAGVQAGHEHAPGRGADGRSGVVVGETHSLRGKAVDVGGLELFLAVTGKVSISRVVEEDVDQIRGRAGGEGQEACEEEGEDGDSHVCWEGGVETTLRRGRNHSYFEHGSGDRILPTVKLPTRSRPCVG